MELTVNYLAVIVSGVVSMVIGFLWYGIIFKKQWMSLMGITSDGMAEMKMTANKAYLLQFVVSLVMACVLARFINLGLLDDGATSPMAVGINVGFRAWLGFVAPITVGVVLWENKPWKLWFINASSYLVTLVLMGMILALWR